MRVVENEATGETGTAAQIERFEDDIDRRVVRLRLSSAGERLLYESQPALAWQNATRNISPNRIIPCSEPE